MGDLWQEVPEALAFCNAVIDEIDTYKLFPAEQFVRLNSAILSSTSLDSQDEAFTPDILEAI